jgi:hypothetical protein
VATDGPPPNATGAAVLDLSTGAARPLPLPVAVAAFSPDGAQLAVQSDPESQDADARSVRVIDAAGQERTLPQSVSYGVRLAGPAAWSPDGWYLAMVDNAGAGKTPSTITLVSTAPGPRMPTHGLVYPPPIQAPTADVAVLGWRAPDRLLVTNLSAADERRIYEITTAGQTSEVTRVEHDRFPGGPTTAMQAASGLLPAAEVRPDLPVERGPWPWPWRGAALVALSAAAALAYAIWRRRPALPNRRRGVASQA